MGRRGPARRNAGESCACVALPKLVARHEAAVRLVVIATPLRLDSTSGEQHPPCSGDSRTLRLRAGRIAGAICARAGLSTLEAQQRHGEDEAFVRLIVISTPLHLDRARGVQFLVSFCGSRARRVELVGSQQRKYFDFSRQSFAASHFLLLFTALGHTRVPKVL